MGEKLRVIIEVGKKERRVVAGAMDWPGLDRWGKTEDLAIEKLTSYFPRYTAVAKLARLGKEYALQRDVEVVERVSGSGSADFWGIAHVPSEIERKVLSRAELKRRLALSAGLLELLRRHGGAGFGPASAWPPRRGVDA